MLYDLARRLLFHLDPETAHDLTLGALRLICRGSIADFMVICKAERRCRRATRTWWMPSISSQDRAVISQSGRCS